MDGSNLQPPVNPNQFANAREHATPPSPLYPGVSKLFYALLCLGVMMFFSQYYTFDSVIGKKLESSHASGYMKEKQRLFLCVAKNGRGLQKKLCTCYLSNAC